MSTSAGEVSATNPEPSDHTPPAVGLSIDQRAALVDDVVDMLVVIDAHGTLLHTNRQASRLLGWTNGDRPVPVTTFIHPDDRAEALLALERFVDGVAPMRRKRLRVGAGDGDWTWVEILSRNRLGVEGVDGIVISARDVTEQVDAERQLLESEQRFRSLVSASADAIMMMRVDGTVVYRSPQVDHLVGPDSGGSGDDLLEFSHPDDREAVRRAVGEVARGEVGTKERVVARVRISDEWVWYESWIVNQLGVPGVDSLVVYNRDVNAQRLAEESLRRRISAEEMVARIATRFVEVGSDDIECAVSESLAELGEFSAADRSWIFLLHEDGRFVDYAYEWCAEGVTSEIDNLKGVPVGDLPALSRWFESAHPLIIGSVAEMSDDMAAEREILAAQGIRSVVGQAMVVRGELIGLIGLDAVHEEVRWPDQVVWALEACATIFGSALRRCAAETALAVNEARFRAMFDQAADGVRVLDADMNTVYASPAVARITGYTLDELREPGTRLLLVHPDDRDFVEECRQRLRSSPGSPSPGPIVCSAPMVRGYMSRRPPRTCSTIPRSRGSSRT